MITVPGSPADYPVGSYMLINGVGGTITAAWRNPMQVAECNVMHDTTLIPRTHCEESGD